MATLKLLILFGSLLLVEGFIEDIKKNERIPRDLIPYHYDLNFRPDINNDKKNYGTVKMYFKCHKNTTFLHLNYFNMEIKHRSITISEIGGPKLYLESIQYRSQYGIVTFEVGRESINAAKEFVEGKEYFINLDFEYTLGRLTDEGFYMDRYQDRNGTIKYYAGTQLQATEARKMYPCMDEVDMKSTFTVSVEKLYPHQVALSNMPVNFTTSLPDNWTKVTFDTTPLMSTYLIAVVVGEFVKVSALSPPTSHVNISLYAIEDHVKNLEYAKKLAVTQLHGWLDKHTGLPYKEPKLDHIVLPNKKGAMENWGLITYGKMHLCIDDVKSDILSKFEVITVVSHEIAHQWYGNLITCEWWDDVWLQEGFATFYNYLPTEVLGFDWTTLQLTDSRGGRQHLLHLDPKIQFSEPVKQIVGTPGDSKSAFNSGAYTRGGIIVRMLQGILTRDVLERALTKFLKKFAYKNVKTEDLTAVLNEEAVIANITYPDKTPLKFDHILHSWLKLAALPLLQISRLNLSTIAIQQDILISPSNVTVPDDINYSWEIPMNLVDNKSPSQQWDMPPNLWMKVNTSVFEVELEPEIDWYLLNPRQYFYYSVHYDSSNNQALARQFKTNFSRIPVESRGQLLHDYFELSRLNKESISVVMDFTVSLQNDLHYIPWNVALYNVDVIKNFMENETFYLKFKLYFQKKLDIILERLKYAFPENETLSTSFLRRKAFYSACSLGSKTCLDFAEKEYENYASNPDVDSVDPNMLVPVLCNGVKNGAQKDFDMVREQYSKRRSSWVAEERTSYIHAMSCSKNESNLDMMIDDLFYSDFFYWEDYTAAAGIIASTEYGSDWFFDYLDNNWNNKSNRIDRTRIMRTITHKWYSDEQLLKFEGFMKRHNQTNSDSWLKNSFLQVKDNNAFHRVQAPILGEWLENNTKHTPKPETTREMVANHQHFLPSDLLF